MAHDHLIAVSDIARDLRTISRLMPDAEAADQAVARALNTSRMKHRARLRLIVWRAAIPSAVAAALILWALVASPTGTLMSPTWADVTRQISDLKQVYFDVWVHRDDRIVERHELYVKPPTTIRAHNYRMIDNNPVLEGGSIMTSTGGIRWNAGTHLADHVTTDNPYVAGIDAAQTFLAMLGVGQLGASATDIQINANAVRFAPVEEKHPQTAGLRGFRLHSLNEKVALPSPFDTLIYWFDAHDNTLRRVSFDKRQARADVRIDLHPSLPANWFSLEIPKGYVDADAPLRTRLSPEVRQVYDAVATARQRFGDYRAVIWRDQTGGWPSYREAVRGEQWRLDRIDWGVMHSAMHTGNSQAFVRINPDDPFDKLWTQVTRSDYTLQNTAMVWQNRFAVIHYNLAGRGPRTSAKLYDNLLDNGYADYFGPALRFSAWPEWFTGENITPTGRDVREPLLTYRVLPADPQQPTLVDVVGERNSKHAWSYVRYTMDREKDYLCIRQELRRYPNEILLWETTDLKQTPDGKWYPRRIRFRGFTYDYAIDAHSSAGESFFAWPDSVSAPTDAFAVLRKPIVTPSSPPLELPPTAKGKYTTFEPRGLPRGFHDQATIDAYSAMCKNMRQIRIAITEYAQDHQWQYPATLAELVKSGKLKAEQLTNPLHPDAEPPFGYIPPSQKRPNSLERMVLHEPFTIWPGVVSVMFLDESVEHIHSEAEFQRLLKEATSPEPPSRPHDP